MNSSPHPVKIPARVRAIAVLALASLAAAFSGCVSAKYKLAEPLMNPAYPLNLRGVKPPVELTLNSVIVYGGPGSWKQEAYWDEYVFTVVDTGTKPLIVDAAVLTDFQGELVEPSDNPWKLEEQSRTYQAQMAAKFKDVLKVGGGAALVGSGGALFGISALMTGAPLAFAAVPALAAAPVFIGVSVHKNNNRKRLIESEFERRRLAFPATIAPGQVLQGSLFFRITPGPKQLNLRYRVGGEFTQASFELSRLSGLHLE